MATAADMQAIQISSPGGMEQLKLTRCAVPKPGPGEVLIRNNVAGVNFLDILMRKGACGPLDVPYTMGMDGAGQVSQAGPDVSDLRSGDRVAYVSMRGGSYAEYVVVPAEHAIKIPDGMNAEMATAGMIQGMTAVAFGTLAYPIKSGDTVLIHAAAGGTGQLLSQVACSMGAKVIGTTSTVEKIQTAKECGAQEMILHTKQNILDEVMRITGNKGVDAVFDSVGMATWQTSLKCLKHLGTLVSFGSASGEVHPISLDVLTPMNIKLMRPSVLSFIRQPGGFRELAGRTFDMIQKAILKIHIHATYSLDQASMAHKDLEERRTKGKILLAP